MTDKENYVLNSVNIKSIDIPIDLNILMENVKKDIESNKEYYDDISANYIISNPKKAEWILHKSIKDSKLVGNGNTNIDVKYKDKGIDVGVITLNGKKTNEKSIIQNFSCKNLDEKFTENKCSEAVDIFKDKLKEKYTSDKSILDHYYALFICNKKNIYLTFLKLDICNITNIYTGSLTRSCKNIAINNFINPKLGLVNLYKSKKRIELRLLGEIIKNINSIKIY
jgi:hypothetical protein